MIGLKNRLAPLITCTLQSVGLSALCGLVRSSLASLPGHGCICFDQSTALMWAGIIISKTHKYFICNTKMDNTELEVKV